MTTFVEKIHQVHDVLASAEMDHAFGGALALMHYVDQPRATADIDVCLFVADAAVVRSVLADATWPAGAADRLADVGDCRLFWDGTYLDVFTIVHDFHLGVAERVVPHVLAGRELPFISANDLAVFKAMFDRTKDWADIEAMHSARSLNLETIGDHLDAIFEGPNDRSDRVRSLRHSVEPRSISWPRREQR